ncbi:MAG TPA: zf-HC2 domain-containing protein [Thermoanaerobaculia bacterium]|jgi:anti-sigma factor (TIGR02949 family)|nr:zf-HC2 domain-containing protein [Thermoanaerobaculia bacterium]
MNQELRCEETLEVLESYLDGDLPPAESSRLREHLERCPACAAELELAGRIQRELRSLPELDCPPEVIERVRQSGRGEVVPFRPREQVLGLRLATAAALLAMAIGGGALFFHFQQQADRPTPREIAQATAEARYALAYIGKVTRRTRLDVRDEVFEKRLVAPAARNVSRALGSPPADQSKKEL